MTDVKCGVSICMPTYNGARYLRSAIESALTQTYPNFELIVVDDGSSDATLAIAREYSRSDSRIKIHQNQGRLGLAGNWNRCMDLATGEWIKFLFQDDYLHPECVARMLEGGSQSGALIVACDREFAFEPDVPPGFKEEFIRKRREHSMVKRFGGEAGLIDKTAFAATVAQYPESNCVGEPTVVMFRRSAVDKFGYFNAELVQLLDWEYWTRLAVNEGLYYVPAKLATFRLHGGAATMSNLTKEKYKAAVLDNLILQHELVYNEHFEPVRIAALNAEPPIDLTRGLFDYYQRAKSVFEQRSTQPAQTAAAIAKEWKRVQSRYRRLRFFSLKYFPARVSGKVSRVFRNEHRV